MWKIRVRQNSLRFSKYYRELWRDLSYGKIRVMQSFGDSSVKDNRQRIFFYMTFFFYFSGNQFTEVETFQTVLHHGMTVFSILPFHLSFNNSCLAVDWSSIKQFTLVLCFLGIGLVDSFPLLCLKNRNFPCPVFFFSIFF